MVYTGFMCVLMLVSLMGGVLNLVVDIFVVVVVIPSSMLLSLSIVASIGTIMVLMGISSARMFIMCAVYGVMGRVGMAISCMMSAMVFGCVGGVLAVVGISMSRACTMMSVMPSMVVI